MKTISDILESLLDDEDILIDQVKDTGVDKFANTINVISTDIETRLAKLSKDKRFKELEIPSKEEIHKKVFGLFEGLVRNGKTFCSNIINEGFSIFIKYKGKKSIDELNDERGKGKYGPEHPIAAQALQEYFNDCEWFKLKSDFGNIELHFPNYYNQSWELSNDRKNIGLILRICLNYRANAAARKQFVPKTPLDVFGHEIHDGDWCAGTQISCPQIIYGIAKLTKSQAKVYIYDGKYKNMCELKNCIVIKHNDKPVDFSDVKDKPISLA